MVGFLVPLLAGAALGGGGGSSSSSTAQSTNTIAFNPQINIGTGTTFGRASAEADPVARTNATVDNTPQQSAAGADYAVPPGAYATSDLEPLRAGFPWWMVGVAGVVGGGGYLLLKA